MKPASASSGEEKDSLHGPALAPSAARCRCHLTLMVALAFAGLDGCAPTTYRPPPPGRALIDVKPDSAHRDRIDGIRLVSVNGSTVHGTRTPLNPGRNTVRIGFRWPQGGEQEVDLTFHAVEGSCYIVQYDVFPPHSNRLGERTDLEDAAGDVLALSQGSGETAILLAPPALALWGSGLVKRGANEAVEQHKPARYMDLMVVCRHNREGIVRRVRVWPDGRVDAAPWAAHAQMTAP